METKSPSPPSNSPHLLIFPYPAQGHMLALLDFTHHLASNGRFTLTILITPKNLPDLKPLLSTHPSIQTLILPMPSHPKLPHGIESVREIGNHGNLPIMLALRKLHNPILNWFNSHPSPPIAIISDFFLGWTQHLGIPRIAFHSLAVFAISVIDYCFLHIKSTTFQSSNAVKIQNLPTSPEFKKEHLPSVVIRYNESDPDWDLLRDDMIANTLSWGSVFNTFESLERNHLECLKKTRGEQCVYGVGPMNLNGLRNGTHSSSSDVLKWLDACPDESVLYVCFGSQKQLNQNQTAAMAAALEKSGTRFMWVVKMVSGSGYIPVGFEKRVAGRGIVVKEWVPQVEILSHRAVGGFVSHCGWNSVMESLVGGVMILSWAMEAEQFVNAKLLVDLGVAVRVCEGADSVPDSAELGKVIGELMSGESLEKVRAKELRKEAVEAVGANGSSWKEMNELVDKLINLQTSVKRASS